jgi:hypothetical protein
MIYYITPDREEGVKSGYLKDLDVALKDPFL